MITVGIMAVAIYRYTPSVKDYLNSFSILTFVNMCILALWNSEDKQVTPPSPVMNT